MPRATPARKPRKSRTAPASIKRSSASQRRHEDDERLRRGEGQQTGGGAPPSDEQLGGECVDQGSERVLPLHHRFIDDATVHAAESLGVVALAAEDVVEESDVGFAHDLDERGVERAPAQQLVQAVRPRVGVAPGRGGGTGEENSATSRGSPRIVALERAPVHTSGLVQA
jgi:hypothetical protein